MRFQFLLPLVAIALHCSAWGGAAAQQTAAAGSSAAMEAAAVPPTDPTAPTPWDIYLACRAGTVDPSIRKLCDLRLPLIGREFTNTELRAWGEVAQNPPSVGTIEAARNRAEGMLLEAARKVGSATAGNQEFEFREGVDTLHEALQQVLQRHAASAAAAFAVDSQVIEVLGFADYTGNVPGPENRALAERRAQHVARFFRAAGIPDDKINIDVVLVRNPSGDDDRGQPYRKVSIGGMPAALAGPQPGASGAGLGLSLTDMMVGASDFLVERAQAELETYIMRIGVNRICTGGTATTWRRLLPSTCALLPQETDTLRYIPGPTTIQEALRTDLHAMPYGIAEETLGALLAKVDNAARPRVVATLVLLRYLRAVADGTEPLVALGAWEGPTFRFAARDVTIPESVRKVATVARFAHDAGMELGAQFSGAALVDSVTLYVLKALVVRGGPEFTDGLWTRWAAGENAQQVNTVLHAVRTAQRVAKEVEEGWNTLRNAGEDSIAMAHRSAIVSNVVSAATRLLAVRLGSGIEPPPILRDSVLEPARTMVAALTRGDSRSALASLVQLVQAGAHDPAERLSPDYTRLLGFVNDASQASTIDEFSGALESLVGAQGGYLSKRESRSRRYARLNAYVGGNVGLEAADEDGAGLAIGLSVPIGVEIGRASPSRSSDGIFLQFIDLGAVASTRIDDQDEVESLPAFKPGSVVGPGIFWTHGLQDSPLATALGISYFPQGRELENGSRIGAVRATFMVAIDIPLFP